MDGLPANELKRIREWSARCSAADRAPKKAGPTNGVWRRRAPTNPHAARREKAADAWCRWFHARLKEDGSQDPVAFLPDALALIELRLR